MISREISGFRAKFCSKFGGILSQKKTVIRSYLAKFSKKSYSVKKIEKLHPNAIQKVPLGLSTPLVARTIVIFQDFARNFARNPFPGQIEQALKNLSARNLKRSNSTNFHFFDLKLSLKSRKSHEKSIFHTIKIVSCPRIFRKTPKRVNSLSTSD